MIKKCIKYVYIDKLIAIKFLSGLMTVKYFTKVSYKSHLKKLKMMFKTNFTIIMIKVLIFNLI
jgi:hypothetical protein